MSMGVAVTLLKRRRISFMKYLDYPEQQKHGSLDFPYYFYRVTPIHPRYTMPYHWHPLFEDRTRFPGTVSFTAG